MMAECLNLCTMFPLIQYAKIMHYAETNHKPLHVSRCLFKRPLSWKEANFGWFDHYNLQGATNYILDGIPEERFLYPNRFLISEYTVSMYR